MASHSVPIPMSQARGRIRAYVPRGTLPLGAAVALFAALLILFGWLHFVLSLQVADTNQQIHDRTMLLEELRRTNATLRHQVARAYSPRLMEAQAVKAGYQPKQPTHILLYGAFSDKEQPEFTPGTSSPPDAPIVETYESQVDSFLSAILAEFDTWWQ